jgi:hypothetical protein
MCVAIIIGGFLFNISRHTAIQNFTVTYGAGYIGPAILLVILAWTYLLTRSGAVRIDIDSRLIRFHWPSGKVEPRSWSDPRIHIDLYDYSADPIVANPSVRDIRLPNRPKSNVPPEVFAAVLEQAKRSGLSIGVRTPSVAWYGQCQRYEIRPPPSRPKVSSP